MIEVADVIDPDPIITLYAETESQAARSETYDAPLQLDTSKNHVNPTVFMFKPLGDKDHPPLAEEYGIVPAHSTDYESGTVFYPRVSTAAQEAAFTRAQHDYATAQLKYFVFGIKQGGQHGHVYLYALFPGGFYIPVRDLGVLGGAGSPFDTNFNTRDFNRSFGTFILSIVTLGYASAAAAAAAAAAEAAGTAYSMTLGQTLSMVTQANAGVGGGLTQSFLGENAGYFNLLSTIVKVIP